MSRILFKNDGLRYVNKRCKCGEKVKLINPLIVKGDLSGKSHAHCKTCNLEWHWHPFKGIYSHKWKK